MKNKDNSNGIVGKSFHTFVDGKVNEQGSVICHIIDEYYLVQLYSWFDGIESNQKIYRISDMLNWKFYNNDESMNDYYQRVLKHKKE